jgi:hypothetical protein
MQGREVIANPIMSFFPFPDVHSNGREKFPETPLFGLSS